MTATQTSLRRVAREAFSERVREQEGELRRTLRRDGEFLHKLIKKATGYELPFMPDSGACTYEGIRFRIQFAGGKADPEAGVNYSLYAAVLYPDNTTSEWVTVETLADVGALVDEFAPDEDPIRETDSAF